MNFICDRTKAMIDNQLKQPNMYLKKDINERKVYAWTNEDINAYLKLMKIKKGDRALTVLGSGDQLFNLISNGVYNIDTFDINELTEYFALGLKKAQIEKYDYNEFVDAWKKISCEDITLEELTELLNSATNFMDGKYKKFWRKIIEYNYKAQKNSKYPINLITLLSHGVEYFSVYNSYVENKDDYNKLKDNLSKVNIKFKNINAENISKNYNKKTFDLIILSNILDYLKSIFTKENLDEFIDMLYKVSNDDARIMLYYSFYFDPIVIDSGTLIKGTRINYKDYEEFIYELGYQNLADRALILKK